MRWLSTTTRGFSAVGAGSKKQKYERAAYFEVTALAQGLKTEECLILPLYRKVAIAAGQEKRHAAEPFRNGSFGARMPRGNKYRPCHHIKAKDSCI